MKILSGIAGFVFLAVAAAQAETPPVGAHDPEAITCNAPELVAASKARGWPLCVQNEMLDRLGAMSLASAPVVDRPSGEGDPAAVTCRSVTCVPFTSATIVGAVTEHSSRPSMPCSTKARTVPSRASASAIGRTNCGA